MKFVLLCQHMLHIKRPTSLYSDDRDKQTCGIMSTQVTYKTVHISLLCGSIISIALYFYTVKVHHLLRSDKKRLLSIYFLMQGY